MAKHSVLASLVLLLPFILCAPPHIFMVIVDDFGWANIGYHADPSSQITTPTLDRLASEGRKFNRHYVHYVCSPTRTSFQSGRLPVHVNTVNSAANVPSTGIPRNMTGIAEKLASAGYRTHFVGKWDCGMATPQHPPNGRGYNTSLHYFSHANNYWNERQNLDCTANPPLVDLWHTSHPANQINGTNYEEVLFGNEIQTVLSNHPADTPLFLVYAAHISHAPLQVPQAYFDQFANISNNDEAFCGNGYAIYPGYQNYSCRRQYTAMIKYLDDQINNITTQLQAKGMWNNTIMALSADNGGCINLTENAGNNYPHRGGKYSPWEGGIRVNAFVTGGLIPPAVRGTTINEIVHIADWYATFSKLAGVDPTDHRAAQYGLPPIDSLDLWPLISGQNNTSPRTEVPVDAGTLVSGQYKLIAESVSFSTWTAPIYPNKSSTIEGVLVHLNCSATGGCLFDLVNDPNEYNDIASKNPDIVKNLQNRLAELKSSYWNNQEKGVDSCPSGITIPCVCYAAQNYYGDFIGPWQFLNGTSFKQDNY